MINAWILKTYSPYDLMMKWQRMLYVLNNALADIFQHFVNFLCYLAESSRSLYSYQSAWLNASSQIFFNQSWAMTLFPGKILFLGNGIVPFKCMDLYLHFHKNAQKTNIK